MCGKPIAVDFSHPFTLAASPRSCQNHFVLCINTAPLLFRSRAESAHLSGGDGLRQERQEAGRRVPEGPRGVGRLPRSAQRVHHVQTQSAQHADPDPGRPHLLRVE